MDQFCSEDSLSSIIKKIKQEKYSGLVFAGCTPQIIEMKIVIALEKYGLNDFPLEIANIREQCAWVHSKDESNYKAGLIIKSHIKKLLKKSLSNYKFSPLEKNVAIIGGGIAGIKVASELQKLGYNVFLIEKNDRLGGRVYELPVVHPYNISGEEFVQGLLNELDMNKIKLFIKTDIEWITGKLGNYSIKLIQNGNTKNENIIVCSSIIFTTGHDIYKPQQKNFYKFGVYDNVITLYELGKILNDKNKIEKNNSYLKLLENPSRKARILFIQCVGSRDRNAYDYCSKYCCTTAINYSIKLIEKYPHLEIYVCYIDIRTPWKNEYEYQKALNLGVNFIRGKVGSIEKEGEKLVATVYDSLINKLMKIRTDLIILSTAMIPNKNNIELFEQINVKTWHLGFIKEKYSKSRTIETSRNGIFACGTVLGPKLIDETLAEATAVALEVSKLLDEPKTFMSRNFTSIDPEKCNGCELCVRICPFNIPYMIITDEKLDNSNDLNIKSEVKNKIKMASKDSDRQNNAHNTLDGSKSIVNTFINENHYNYLAVIDPFSCRGCGTCNAICPTGAAQLKNYSQNEIFAQIEGLLEDSKSFEKPILIGFVCDECAYASIDVLGMLRKKYPENIRLIRIPCAGRLSLLDILKCYSDGASGVFLIGCLEDKCHYIDGNIKAKAHIEAAEEILQSIGWKKGRTRFFGSFAADSHNLYENIIDYVNYIEKLGKNPKISKI
ncbi:MAG: hydrogenase iron-sulfur subunit [Candidatus Helarchaeota archaeon]